MSLLSLLIGAGIGAIAMKIYMDQTVNKYKNQLKTEHKENVVREEELAHSDNVEFTADGMLETNPTNEEIIIATVKSLKKSKQRISTASVSRESGLSTYKVGKHKDLIEKLKSK